MSPAWTTTEPLACLASLPVSNEISVPPISTETRVTSDNGSFLSPVPVRTDLAFTTHSVVVARHGSDAGAVRPAARPVSVPMFGYHTLRREQRLPGPPGEVFGFFADAGNLEAITPPWLGFTIVTPRPIDMHVGTIIEYRLKLHGLPLRWLTQIEDVGARRALRRPPAARALRPLAPHARVRAAARRRHADARRGPLRAAARPGRRARPPAAGPARPGPHLRLPHAGSRAPDRLQPARR